MKFLSDLDLTGLCQLKNTLLERATADPTTYYPGNLGALTDSNIGLICHYDNRIRYFGKAASGGTAAWQTVATTADVPTYSTANCLVVTDGSKLGIASPYFGVSGSDLVMNLDGTRHKIIQLADPIDTYDAANKHYVDSIASGLSRFKDACAFASTANTTGTFNAGVSPATITGALIASFDTPGITVTTTMRVLVKDQTAKLQNGIYTITAIGGSTYDLARATDSDVTGELADGTSVFVSNGATFARSTWVITNSGTSPIMNTDPINWALFSQIGNVTAGAGLTLTGSVFSANIDSITTWINGSNQLAVKAATTNYKVLLTPTGSAAATATWGQLDLGPTATYVTGVLNVANGGTSRNALTAYNLLVGNGTSAVGLIAPSATSGAILMSQGAAANPAYQVMSGDATLNGAGALTLASVIAAAGPIGTASVIPVITYDAKGRLTTVSTVTVASPTVTTAADSATSAGYVGFVNAASGNLSLRTSSVLTYNATNGTLAATTFSGALSGNATTATTATNATNATNVVIAGDDHLSNISVYPCWTTGISGALPIWVSSGKLVYNPFSGTLTLPSVRLAQGILDNNGASILSFTATTSAVNYFTMTNGATGNAPRISLTSGTDAQVDLRLEPKATLTSPAAWGAVYWKDNAVNTQSLRMCRIWEFVLTQAATDRGGNAVSVTGLNDIVVAHEFGIRNVVAMVFDNSTGDFCMVNWKPTPTFETRKITLHFTTPPASGAYRVVFVG